MADEIIKIKVSQLPMATVLDNLEILGVDKSTNKSVRAAMSLLRGLDGKQVTLRATSTHIQWRLGAGAWVDLVALAELKGDTGANIELQKSATHVQWRVAGTSTWNNLIPIDDLKVKGDTGANIELQKSTTHVQWRVVGSPTWNNLVALSELKGEKGDAPVKGVDYFDGKNPVVLIGTIMTVASNAQANATVEPDGVDAEGKPKFKLNLWLPKGVDGEGAGDMLKSVYDPQNKATDVFGYIDGKVGDMGAYKWQYNELTDSLDLIKTV